jgi:imidazolonepropionase-like amidohydrolase
VARFLTDEEIEAAVSEAHRLDRRVSAHCEGFEAARAAVRAGIDCLEHALSLDDALVAEMKERGTAYVPTMWVFLAETEELFGDISAAERPIYEERIEKPHQDAFEAAMRGGLLIGAGTDSLDVVPTQDVLVRELEAMAAGGMERTEVINAATINGARIIGIEDSTGSLTAGKWADVIAVDGDPSKQLRALARPLLVIKGGDVVVDLRADDDAEAAWEQFSVPPFEREGIGRGHWSL